MQRNHHNPRLASDSRKEARSPRSSPDPIGDFADILEFLPEPACVLRQDGSLALANGPMRRQLNISKQRPKGLLIQDLFALPRAESERLIVMAFAHQETASIQLFPGHLGEGQMVEFDGGRLHARDKQGRPLAFLRLRAMGNLSERLRRVTRSLDQRPGTHTAWVEREALMGEIVKLERTVHQDALTGLDNRGSFDVHLEQLVKRAQRDKQPLALVCLDVDDFKRVNDAWGHPVGDRCLQLVADELKRVARRPLDLAARTGGEEFSLLLPDCDQRDALQVARSVRQAIANAGIEHPDGFLTVSVGVVSRQPGPKLQGKLLYEAADKALYQAKRLGKNRVCSGR